MKTSSERQDSLQKLAHLIQDIDIAMLTTVCGDGTLRSRPMKAQQREFDGTLWFFTSDSSPKSIELQEDARVNVCFSEPKRQHYVSVSGEAELVHDRAKISELWNPAYKAWFPKGLEDPDLALIRVEVTHAEYWDAPSSAMVHLFGLVKATMTGKPARPGDHDKIDLAG